MAKLRLKKGSERFPNAQIGDEVEINDEQLIEKLERDGTVERSAMSADERGKQQAQQSGRQDGPSNRPGGGNR